MVLFWGKVGSAHLEGRAIVFHIRANLRQPSSHGSLWFPAQLFRRAGDSNRPAPVPAQVEAMELDCEE